MTSARINIKEIKEDPYVNFGICVKKSERDWLKAYAKKHNTSMSQLFRDFLKELKEEEINLSSALL